MQVTIYTVTYNEELILPHFIRHYRRLLPGCRIVVFDNQSTDRTVPIAMENNCEVITYETGNQLNDMKYLEIKNHAWKTPDPKPEPHWVFVVDADEFCEVTYAQLQAETKQGVTMLQFAGYNMVNLQSEIDLPAITHGVPAPMYSKRYAFRSDKVTDINYNPGCHVCNPAGEVVLSATVYPCYHYRYLSLPLLISRYKHYLSRMCAENKRKGMGSQYAANAQQITDDFNRQRSLAQPVRNPMPSPQLRVFIGGFSPEHFNRVPATEQFIPVNLGNLQLGALQNNLLSEHRLFLSDMPETNLQNCPPATYTGLLTWRWHQKCRHLVPLHKIPRLDYQPNTVWAAWPAPNWYRHSVVAHKGIQPYLNELCHYTGLKAEGTGLYGNNFICSVEVFEQFRAFFLQCFEHFHTKYGFKGYHFWVKENDLPRLPAVFYERIAALYFANRHDLTIKQIPHRGSL